MEEIAGLAGQGTEKIILSDHKGLVVLHFEKPVDWVALEPQVASELAEAMARQSYRAKFGDDPTTTDRSQITEQIRVRMVARVTLMLRSYFKKPTQFTVMATNIVDEIFKAVA